MGVNFDLDQGAAGHRRREGGFVMTTGRLPLLVAAGLLGSAAIGSLGGCSSPGPIASHRATVGSLKASVSQLEYANDNLKKQVAQLKSESDPRGQ